MKKVSVIIILLFTILIFSSTALAQDDGYRVFGIGVNVLDFNGLLAGNGGTIYIPINVAPVFRLEPYLGFNTTSYDYEGDDDESETGIQFGIGISGMIRRGSALIYIGGRIGFVFDSYEEKDMSGDVAYERSSASFGIGPILGGEYYFNPHVSLGGEASIIYRSTTRDVKYPNEPYMDGYETTTSGLGTESMIFIRFYF